MPKTLRLNKDWLKATHLYTANFIGEIDRLITTYQEEVEQKKTAELLRWWAAESMEFKRIIDYHKKQARKFIVRYERYVKNNTTKKRRKKRGET